MVDRDSRIRAILAELPRDRTITKAEAERFLVELYRVERNSERVAARMGCSGKHVLRVVRRIEPGLIWRGRRAGKPAPLPEQVYDLRKARDRWRVEGYRIRRAEQDMRMLKAYEAGTSIQDIAKRECLGRDAVLERIAAAAAD